ncbi:MAG TPA: hypothetical protein VFS22_06330 [Flavisolibacter sp.]|jgi:hypothetical protein|nr:hypothetical protein [Flavisolibacter sp.]
MIKNFYYLVAGILAIVFSVTHALNGQNSVLPSLNIPSISVETKTVFFYVWHIITAENMLFGAAFIFMAFQKNLSNVRFAALIIAILLVVRWLVIFAATLRYNAAGLKNIVIDSVAIVIYVSLIIFGTKVRDKGQQVGA